MLTSDLAVNWRRGDKLYPRLIKTDDAGYLEDAENLIGIFEDFDGRTRGELERELEEYVGTGTDYRILRGFIKLLSDRCEFETAVPIDPVEIRRMVFTEAKRHHPVLPGSAKRNEVLKLIGDELHTDSGEISSNLYADLSDRQKLVSFASIAAPDLLDRYNLAQAQALLYKCVELKISVAPSSAENYRSIFGSVKRFGLIYSIDGDAASGYEITLTGAASLFHRSQKYGIRMAVFLPALLLCKDWKCRAEISQKEGRNVFYELAAEQTELKSCYWDEPEYKNSDIEKLKTDWAKSSPKWHLQENYEVIDLGKTAFIPDFVLISPDGGNKVYFDILGFWTPKTLVKRLEEYQAANFRRFIFAASQELRGSREEPLWESESVYFYKTKIIVRELAEKANNLFDLND